MVAFILSACIAVQTPTALKPEIRAVSIFRNGYAVVLRDINLKVGDNMLDELPQALVGTVLFLPDKGVNVEEVVSTLVEQKQEVNATSLEDLLAIGIGKHAILNVKDIGIVQGTLISVDGTIVMLRNEGRIHAVQKAAIFGVNIDGSLDPKRRWTSHRRALRFRSRTGGKLVMLSVEQGMSWSPSYAIDITEPKRLTLTGKSIIINSLRDLSDVHARLVTGYPNISFTGQIDPLLTAEAIQRAPAFGGGGGNLQPGQGLVPKGIDHIGYDPTDNTLVVRGEAMSGADVEQAEDLFYYSLPGLTMKLGDKSYRVLLEHTTPYSHLYTWHVPSTISPDYHYAYAPDADQVVWHNLKFTNESESAWTQAPAIITRNRDVLAQSILPYTSKGEDAILPLTMAMDVKAEHVEEEVTRERGALKRETVFYDLVTLKATMVVTNRKSEPVHIKMTRVLVGEVVTTSDGAKVTKTVGGLRDLNASARVEWEKDVAPGKSVEVTVSYKVYVRTQ